MAFHIKLGEGFKEKAFSLRLQHQTVIDLGPKR
jgi:hypothetical protein